MAVEPGSLAVTPTDTPSLPLAALIDAPTTDPVWALPPTRVPPTEPLVQQLQRRQAPAKAPAPTISIFTVESSDVPPPPTATPAVTEEMTAGARRLPISHCSLAD
jgi:hypothetical protein